MGRRRVRKVYGLSGLFGKRAVPPRGFLGVGGFSSETEGQKQVHPQQPFSSLLTNMNDRCKSTTLLGGDWRPSVHHL